MKNLIPETIRTATKVEQKEWSREDQGKCNKMAYDWTLRQLSQSLYLRYSDISDNRSQRRSGVTK